MISSGALPFSSCFFLKLSKVAAGFPRGFADYHREPDRRAAIALALSLGRAGDVILLAGKGHETYQIIGTEHRHLDEREEVAAHLAQREA